MMSFPTKALVVAGLLALAPVAVFADTAPDGCTSAAGVADSNGATSFNDAVGELLPSGSSAVDDVTADGPIDSPVTILVPTNSALDRNETRDLTRSGDLQGVIETHVIMGEVDAASVADGDTATTVSGETVVFSVEDGQVTASIDGGADSVVLGDRQESCAGPVYIVDAPLRPKALAPAVAPVPEVAPPAPVPEVEPPVPEAEPPVPEAEPPVPEAEPPVPEAEPPAPEAEPPVAEPVPVNVTAPAPAEEPTVTPVAATPRAFVLPPVDGPMEAPMAAPMEAPMMAPEPAPLLITPEMAPMAEPMVAPAPLPLIAVPSVAPVAIPPMEIAVPGIAPIETRDFVLPVDTPALAPAECTTLAHTLRDLNPELLAATQALPEEFQDVINDPMANITILSPPAADLAALVDPNLDPEVIIQILLAHIILEPYTADELVAEGDGFELMTANEDVVLELDLTDGVAFILGNITATVTEADYPSCAPESVIHVIDAALIPEGIDLGTTRDALPPVEAPDEGAAFSVATIVPAVAAAFAGAALLL